jgi:3',5'-cyclic AMP phosphodiesterase CpdA
MGGSRQQRSGTSILPGLCVERNFHYDGRPCRFGIAMLVAQVSDPHVTEAGASPGAGVDSYVRLASTLRRIAELVPRPEAIVLSGDLVEAGTAAEYARLAGVLAASPIPVHVMAGNHDDRDALAGAFPDHAERFGDHGLHYALDLGPLRLVMLDSLVPGKPGGALPPGQVDWLDTVLSARTRTPTVVFVHHPPATTGLAHVDRSALADDRAFAATIRRHRQVVRVSCGHLHRAVLVNWAGTALSVCPSTAHQFVLDLRPDGRLRPVDEPPAYQLHRWHRDALHTYTLSVALEAGRA